MFNVCPMTDLVLSRRFKKLLETHYIAVASDQNISRCVGRIQRDVAKLLAKKAGGSSARTPDEAGVLAQPEEY